MKNQQNKSEIEQELWNAIESGGGVEEVKRIIEKDVSVVVSKNMMDDGWTALHYAAKEGNLEVVKLLLHSYHADANIASGSSL